MTTSKLTVDEGTTTPLATYEINEDAEDKQLSRTVLNAEDGTELGTVADPLVVTGAVTLSEPISVDDNGGSLTVDGPVTDAQLRATPVPVSGTVTATTPITTEDYDTGAGTDTVAAVGILLPKSGGAVAGGTSTDPVRTDPTGTTTQPVSAASLPLPSGAATAANQQTDALTDTELRATPVPVSGTVSVNEPVTVDGTVTADTELTTEDYDTGGGTDTVAAVGILLPKSGGAVAGGTSTDPIRTDPTGTTTQPVSAASLPLPTGAATAANQQTDALTDTELRATPVPVSATNLDVRDLTFAADKVDASGTVLGAGTNAIGKLAANSGVDIGDVDVTSLPSLPAGTNNIGDVDVLTLPALPAGTNNIGDVDVASLPSDVALADDAAFTPATTKVIGAGFFADETSTDSVDEGDIGAARMTPDRRAYAVNTPHSAGGCDIFRSLDLDETEEEVKASAGTVYGYFIANLSTATRFVKFYNATAANVTVGTTTPVLTLPIPGNSTDDQAANLLGGVGIKFDTAITVAATTGLADNDTGAPAANDVVVNLFYK